MAGVKTLKRGGSRFYIDPDDTAVKVPGVTSIVGMLPKDFLTFWAAKVTAETCVTNRDVWWPLAERDPKGAVDYLKGAHRRVTKDAADLGSMAHDLFERQARGETINPRHVHADVKNHIRWFDEWLQQVQPEFLYMEDTVWSDAHEYAGSFDAIARIDGETVLIDYKTSKEVYDSVALQLAAYRYADRIILAATEESIDVPPLDGGAVLHVRPEGWKFVPVDCGPAVFRKFLALRTVFDWEQRMKKGVVRKALARGGEFQTGTQRRAA